MWTSPVVTGATWRALRTTAALRSRTTGPGALGDASEAPWWEDPLAGLRTLRDGDGLEPLHGLARLPESVERRNLALGSVRITVRQRLTAALPDVTGDGVVPDAALTHLVNAAFDEAMRADRDLSAVALAEPVAEAIAASLFALVVDGPLGLDTDFSWTAARETVTDAFAERLGAERGGRRAVAGLLTYALRKGGRRALMNLVAVGTGDVLVHAAHRTEILDRLDGTVGAVPAGHRLVLVGHSLGGVIAFDVLDRGADVEAGRAAGPQWRLELDDMGL
jgi:hypothetical protein